MPSNASTALPTTLREPGLGETCSMKQLQVWSWWPQNGHFSCKHPSS